MFMPYFGHELSQSLHCIRYVQPCESQVKKFPNQLSISSGICHLIFFACFS
ncbi:Uncharacterized protein TCM_007499 [Theobroma cacao]|uniref:Uncharacterized protein n=1 Tax=Theobroma cacao TaxID=3641 RepID=A0A061E1A7_THECC|nr:Uncharacterized protein TCM_007499 [Theobroma cacao]